MSALLTALRRGSRVAPEVLVAAAERALILKDVGLMPKACER